MLWGSKESLYAFLEENGIKNTFVMRKNENENKAGIYICINITKKIGYIIIWTGKFSYQYSKITETNENMLLTLIRYGFYLSSNSILCLTKEEVEDFKYNGYEIFQDSSTTAFTAETNRIEINENEEKNFKLEEQKNLTESIKKLKNKKIIKSIINKKNLLFFEESDNILDTYVLNYFYHCFDKYPLLGAIEYNFKKYNNKKKIKLSFFIENQYNDIMPELKNYIKELKLLCQNKKKISFEDIDFSCIDEYQNNFDEKDTSLCNFLIKFIEIIPTQIAKIMGYEFKVMSNGENIDKILNIEIEKRKNLKQKIQFNITDYSKMINFCFKESILNYFELPVIVICCFGTQSIGKSTFLNELTGSLFDVSGMRCTEGIWMTIKLFINSLNLKKINCTRKCEICKNNNCYLIRHEIGKKGKK